MYIGSGNKNWCLHRFDSRRSHPFRHVAVECLVAKAVPPSATNNGVLFGNGHLHVYFGISHALDKGGPKGHFLGAGIVCFAICLLFHVGPAYYSVDYDGWALPHGHPRHRAFIVVLNGQFTHVFCHSELSVGTICQLIICDYLYHAVSS